MNKHKECQINTNLNYKDYFRKSASKGLLKKYKHLYVMVVFIGLIAAVGPMLGFVGLCSIFENTQIGSFGYYIQALFIIIGMIGSASIGVGLANLVAKAIDQYLGHKVTRISLGCGVAVTSVCYIVVWMAR